MAELYIIISVFLVNAPQRLVTGLKENSVFGVCTFGYYQCENDTLCIPHHNNCDGKVDCPSGSDEANCEDPDVDHFWDHFVKKRPAALNDDIKVCNLSYNGSCTCRGRDLLCNYRNLTKIPQDLPKERINLLDLELNNFRILSKDFLKAVPQNVDKM